MATYEEWHEMKIEDVANRVHSLNDSTIAQLIESVTRLKYIPVPKHYTPDFILTGKNKKIYIETKGRFLAKDRTKHLLVQSQYPELDLRFVFTNPNAKLYKGSKTTYGEWCIKYGFIFSKGRIPESWIGECMRGS